MSNSGFQIAVLILLLFQVRSYMTKKWTDLRKWFQIFQVFTGCHHLLYNQ